MLSRLLREFLFTLLHLILDLFIAVQNAYYRFYIKKQDFSSAMVTKTDIKLILKHVPKINKSLKHLVVLADSDCHRFEDLARLVLWSLVAGIPYFSIYDIKGKIKELNEEKLFLEIERNKKGIPGCIKWANKPDLNGYSNGIQANTIVINIFTCDDGQSKIAQCIRQIAEDKLLCKRKNKEYTAQELDEAMSLIYPSIPDPELVLYTGPLCCTYGLLPWQIRLTEFIQLSLSHSVNVKSYLNALYSYSKCDQRFGK